jgi:hypothetical protein
VGSAVIDSLSFRTFGPLSVLSAIGLPHDVPPFVDFDTKMALLGNPAAVMPPFAESVMW